MGTDQTQPKRPKPPRFTRASLYLMAGVVACYVLLRFMIPALRRVAGSTGPPAGWQGLTLVFSDWVVAHPSAGIMTGSLLVVAGCLLPMFFRPTRYLIWLLALAIILLDLALVAGSLGHTYSTLLKQANQPR